jgi:hypothetical protein
MITISRDATYMHGIFGKDDHSFSTTQLLRDGLLIIIRIAIESSICLLSNCNKLGLIELVGKKITIKDSGKLKKWPSKQIRVFKN